MKILFLVFALNALQCVFAEPGPAYLYAKAKRSTTVTGAPLNGIPAAFSGANPKSKVLSSLEKYGNLKVWNSCTTPIYVNVSYSGSNVPPDNDVGNIFVPAGSGVIENGIPIAGSVYQRSFGASLENCYTVIEVN